jgi:NAD(P)H dehydrogenase (quinone)
MILVTGATGHVGRAVLACLEMRGVHDVAVMARSRDKATRVLPDRWPVRIADYNDRGALREVFAGVSRLLLIASDGEGAELLQQHANAIEAAKEAGVSQLVFTSIVDVDADSRFYFTPVYRDAERRLRESGLEWTILRCGLYTEFVHNNWIEPAFHSGLISIPVGAGLIAPITRDDVAAAAVAVLTSGGHERRTYELTGSRAYSFEEIAHLTSAVAARPARWEPCASSDYLLRCWTNSGEPGSHAYMTLYASIFEGRYSRVTNDFRRLTGRDPEDLSHSLTRLAERS